MTDNQLVLTAHLVVSVALLIVAGWIIWLDPAPLDHPTAIYIIGALTGYWFGNGPAKVISAIRGL